MLKSTQTAAAVAHQRAVGTRRSAEWGAHSVDGGEGPVCRVLRARVSVRCACVRVSMRLYAKPPCKGYRPALWYAAAAVCRISSKHHSVRVYNTVCALCRGRVCVCACVSHERRGDFMVDAHKLSPVTGYTVCDKGPPRRPAVIRKRKKYPTRR